MEKEPATTATGDAEKKKPSTEMVQTLSRMIKDLEEQLDRLLAINEALEKDLNGERRKRGAAEQKIAGLEEQLRRAEEEAIGQEDRQVEIDQLVNERLRLSTRIDQLTGQLAAADEENQKNSRLLEQLRAGRDAALEEVQSVEAQFERAMELVADLQTRLAALEEERNALTGRVKVVEEKLSLAEEERDALLAETEESRNALEEIRRSLREACVVSRRPDGSLPE